MHILSWGSMSALPLAVHVTPRLVLFTVCYFPPLQSQSLNNSSDATLLPINLFLLLYRLKFSFLYVILFSFLFVGSYHCRTSPNPTSWSCLMLLGSGQQVSTKQWRKKDKERGWIESPDLRGRERVMPQAVNPGNSSKRCLTIGMPPTPFSRCLSSPHI